MDFHIYFLIKKIKVTEKEIFNGILSAKNTKNNVLFFIREIDDIVENINTNLSVSKKFIDLDKNNQIDEDARDLLNELKYKKIPAVLPDTNIFRFNVNYFTKSIFFS